jgi:hypothetical protein
MNITAQQTEFLSWKVVPARLDATQTAWFLGFEPHEIPRLVTAGLLKPLGHPARKQHEVLRHGGAGTIPPRREMARPRQRCHCQLLAGTQRPQETGPRARVRQTI